jgi:hypothetical protein
MFSGGVQITPPEYFLTTDPKCNTEFVIVENLNKKIKASSPNENTQYKGFCIKSEKRLDIQ